MANPQNNGWSSYDGDFFFPGSPEEGWGISIGTSSNFNNNRYGPQTDIPGTLESAMCLSDGLGRTGARGGAVVRWLGTRAGLEIRQIAVVANDGAFILLHIEITNTTGAAINDLYYMRNVDPDNNQTLSGVFDTTNRIVVVSSFRCLGPIGLS